MISHKIIILFLFALLGFTVYQSLDRSSELTMNGVSLVAPHKEVGPEIFEPIKNINANWVAVIPYSYIRPSENEVKFNFQRQFWGETLKGAAQTIIYAQNQDLKVMLKPHVWVVNQGWAGDYEPQDEAGWEKWEESYSRYLLEFSSIADSLNVPLLCIGTEFRKTAVKRPEYWLKLIKDIRKIYNGKLTYAANWDNYINISFWAELDYIGIDAYFPLSEARTPTIEELALSWQSIATNLKEFSERHEKSILFTEYGYESKDFAADGHWKHENEELNVNSLAQANAYHALFSTFWNEEWFGGGFLWKWFPDHENTGGKLNKRYTPQNKPAEEVIKAQFSN